MTDKGFAYCISHLLLIPTYYFLSMAPAKKASVPEGQ